MGGSFAVEGSTSSPILPAANGPVEEPFIDQITSKTGDIGVPDSETAIDLRLGVAHTRFELLSQEIKHQPSL
jgi:hypothetical protein